MGKESFIAKKSTQFFDVPKKGLQIFDGPDEDRDDMLPPDPNSEPQVGRVVRKPKERPGQPYDPDFDPLIARDNPED